MELSPELLGQWAQMAADPWAFITRYGLVKEPQPGRGIIRFEPWPAIKRLIQLLERERLILVGKARQVGATDGVTQFALHKCLFNEAAEVLAVSKTEDDAAALIGKARLTWGNLPPEHKLTMDVDNNGELHWPAVDSRMKALPATRDAGRSKTASVVVFDEMDFHPYAEDEYVAAKPSIDRGAQFVGISTLDKGRQDSFFKTLWRGSPANGFVTVFMDWRCAPWRNQAWFDGICKEYSPVKREQEYPDSEEEALRPSAGACYFDVVALTGMQPGQQGHIYRRFIPGRRYVAALDPAGTGKDKHSLTIRECHIVGTNAVVYASTEGYRDFAFKAKLLLEQYGNPLLQIEPNGVGQAMIEVIRNLGYTRFVYKDRDKGVVGWPMTGTFRDMMLADYAESIRLGDTLLLGAAEIAEHFAFLRQEKGPPKAASGAHDDMVMSSAWANWTAKQVTVGGGELYKPQTLSYASV